MTRPDRRTAPTAPLTPRQAEVLTLIYAVIEAEGRRPTYRELLEVRGLRNKHVMAGHLAGLERKGYIRRHPTVAGRARPFTLLRLPDGSPFRGFAPIRAGDVVRPTATGRVRGPAELPGQLRMLPDGARGPPANPEPNAHGE